MTTSVRPGLILLVEDDRHEQAIYGDLLWYNGFDVVYVATAEQGYWLAREGEPDLIILDLNLPDGDGLTLCRRLKADPHTASIPVLALSARPEEPYGALSLGAGCARYLAKPKPPVEVLEEVIALIGVPPPGGPPPNRPRAG